MRWLCIEVHFLAGHYHGRGDEGRQHQWPPNPHRLFQALIAAGNLGFRRLEFSDSKVAALRWLECLSAPEIAVPSARAANVVRLYVPNNDMDKVARAWTRGKEPEKEPSELRTDKDLRPYRLDGRGPICFLWPITDGEWDDARSHVELLCAEARHLHSLGLGIDLVAGNGSILTDAEKNALPGEVWIASSDGVGWRVPDEGSLDELLDRHRKQSERVRVDGRRGPNRWVTPSTPPTVYREVAYRRRAHSRLRPVHAFAMVDEEENYRSFDARRAIEIAAWARHAMHQRATAMRLDADFIEAFVCGHGADVRTKEHRFSYLPLPTIPFKGRDGRIRRVIIVEPFGGGGRKAQELARRLSGMPLVEEGTGEVKADLRQLFDPFSDVVTARYLCRGHVWGSVTPLVLPGRDDHQARKSHALVLKALAQAGYITPVVEIALQQEPVFPGAEMARVYRVPTYLKPFPRTHAIITFAEEVHGPVVVGAGRHVGLGSFAALE